MSKNKSNFLVQGGILALAGLLSRLIGLVYRIPLNNVLGNEGIGYYSNAYSVYSIFLLISSTSLPVAVSKIVSGRMAKKEVFNAKRAFLGAMVFALFAGGLCTAIVFFGADFFANLWKYPSMALALRVLAPTIFVVCVLGVLRGFFQGLGTMIPTALSQIFEQIVNAIVSVVAAVLLCDIGARYDKAAAYSAAGGTLGTLVGAISALLFMGYVYILYRPILDKKVRRDKVSIPEKNNELAKVLLVTIVPVLLSTTIYNISSIIDSALFGNIMSSVFNLEESQYSSLFGIYSGKYTLLTTAPIAIASSLASAIIPSLIRTLSTGNKTQLLNKIDSSIRLSMIVAIPCGVGISVLAEPFCNILFPDKEMMDVCIFLMRFAVLKVVVYSLSTITNSILQGIDKMSKPVTNSAISLGIHIVLVVVLLVVFKMDILGILIADIIFAFIVCILNARCIKKFTGYKQEFVKTFGIPFLCAGIMGVISFFVYKGIMAFVPVYGIGLVGAVLAAILVYAFFLVLFKGVNEEELKAMPKGELIIKFYKKLHLM